ncbi:MAG: hypothetical protein RLZZ06_701 [Actinomycetota bacterium]
MAKKNDVTPGAEILAKFDTYEAAVEHVEKLLAGNFPVRQIAIVGRGIRTVERTRGRINYARIALTGAFNGAIVGLAFHTFSSADTSLAGYSSAVVTFAGGGALVNLVRFSLSRNKRTFVSQQQLVADTYEIQIPRDLKAAAEDALAKQPKPSK